MNTPMTLLSYGNMQMRPLGAAVVICDTVLADDSAPNNGSGAKLQVTGNITATGSIQQSYSDERLKDKLGNITNAIDKLRTLNGFYYKENALAKTFDFNEDKIQIGLSAQEVEKVFPEVVSLAPFDMIQDEKTKACVSKSGKDYKSLDYAKLIPVLIEAIKEQQTQIDEIKTAVRCLGANNATGEQ